MQTTTFIKRIVILFILCLINFGFIEKVQSIDLTINAKGSEAEEQYAHFKVLADGQEIGDSFTTTDFEQYKFPLSTDPSTIKEIRVVYDNDAAGNGMDRNLYVESIQLGSKAISAINPTVVYVRNDGQIMDYTGIMRWNGDLIFAIEDIFNPIPYSYNSFQGDTYDLFLWEGEKVAILSKEKNLDKDIMQKMVDTFDKVFDYYYKTTGRKPGLNYHYNGKTTIAQVDNTCGAGCAYLGITGIELLDYYFDLLYSTLRDGDLYDQVVFYEFGRNFWFYGKKIDWSGSVGTVTTGYAVFMRFMSMRAAGINGAPFGGRHFIEFEFEVKGLFDIYMADASLNWENTIKIGKGPANSMNLGGTDLFASFMFKLIDLFGTEFNDAIWKEIEKRPDAINEYDAADNFILASSIVANQNLIPIFQYWKWPVSQAAIEEANQLFGTTSLVVNAKGSHHYLNYAHFKVLVDGQEIGEAVTTSDYMPYFFSTSIDPSTIQEVQVVFDNDAAGSGMDRNLYVESIQLADRVLSAIDTRAKYVRNDGQIMDYSGIMRWNGVLIFDIEEVPVVCEGDILLSSQAEVDAFSCKTIEGSLTIMGDDITDLSPLSNLEQITGALIIRNNSNLPNLNGLNNLRSCGPIAIDKNPGLENIDAINSSSFYTLDVIDNNSLKEIRGFNSISGRIFGIFIYNNPTLQIIEGFNSIQECEHIYIISNESLKILRGLNSLLSFYSDYEGGLDISNNIKLEIIDAFESLEWCSNYISIGSNLSLKKIEGFNALKWVMRTLGIYGNSSLQSIDGFNSLGHSGGLGISSNELLKNITGFNSFSGMDYDEYFVISNNPLLEEINGFASFTTGGTLTISDNGSLENLDFLSTITFLYSTLEIRRNSSLVNIDGLKSLEEASEIDIFDNGSLVKLDGLTSLRTLGILEIENNPNLVSFCGLYPLFNEGDVLLSWSISNNGIEITKEEILSNGPCASNGLVINAKGSEYDGIFAHFKVIIDGQEIGDAVTTSDYEPYIFSLSKDPSSIQEVKVVFDNDAAGNGMDRNLYVESIQVGYMVLPAIDPSVMYVRNDGQSMEYAGIMRWNGALIFDTEHFSGVCKGNIILSSQAEVDAFDCIVIEDGGLIISGYDITNVDGLSALEEIYGMWDDYTPTSGLDIINNNLLNDLNGLSALQVIDGRLDISNNAVLENIDGFQVLETIDRINVSNNNSLKNLDGFSKLTNVESLSIRENNALKHIDGFESLVSCEFLSVINNSSLIDITGFNSLRSAWALNVQENRVLENCCGFYPFLSEGSYYKSAIFDNGSGCTVDDILANGPCHSKIELIANVKGSQYEGYYAHFTVLVDDQEIGDAVTTSVYKQYVFTLSKDPSTIQEVEVVFDNDAAGNGMDRNLYVESIEIDGLVIMASGENVTYTRSDGSEYPYSGIMRWNGQLIFDQFELNNADARKSKDSNHKNEEFNTAAKMHVYPNPAEQEYTIELINAVEGTANVIMHDLSGRQVLRHNFYVDETSEIQQIKVSKLERGVYILNLTTCDHQHFLEKVIMK